jgi:hypothetical protein
MGPYVKLALAVMGHKDVHRAVEEITALPLEKRYTWRVASALKWAFADFENLNVVADRRTLNQVDLDKLVDLLKVRPFNSACSWLLFLARSRWKTDLSVRPPSQNLAGRSTEEPWRYLWPDGSGR